MASTYNLFYFKNAGNLELVFFIRYTHLYQINTVISNQITVALDTHVSTEQIILKKYFFS